MSVPTGHGQRCDCWRPRMRHRDGWRTEIRSPVLKISKSSASVRRRVSSIDAGVTRVDLDRADRNTNVEERPFADLPSLVATHVQILLEIEAVGHTEPMTGVGLSGPPRQRIEHPTVDRGASSLGGIFDQRLQRRRDPQRDPGRRDLRSVPTSARHGASAIRSEGSPSASTRSTVRSGNWARTSHGGLLGEVHGRLANGGCQRCDQMVERLLDGDIAAGRMPWPASAACTALMIG